MRFIKFQSQVERCGTHYARANSRNSAQGLVFRYRSYHRTNFGTPCVLVFISVSTFARAQVERCGTHYARANSRNSAQGLVFRYRSYHRTNFGTPCVLVFISTFFRDIFQSACQNQTFELQYLCYREKQLDKAHFAPSRD